MAEPAQEPVEAAELAREAAGAAHKRASVPDALRVEVLEAPAEASLRERFQQVKRPTGQ